MLDQAAYTPRLKAEYIAKYRAAMKAEFGYKNDMQIPKLDKIVLNMGVGEAVKDTKKVKRAVEELTLIAGQKAVITHAKKSIAGFRVREEMPLGCKVTLRGDRMYEFLDRLITIALPRVKDFRGLNGKSFDSKHALVLAANAIGGRHGLGMSDQVENRVIEAKSRGIYEAPGMALLHIAYERLLSVVHNENTLDLYANLGRRLGRILYEGRWYDPEALLLKDALVRWVAASISGSVTIELRRGDDYTILRTDAVYSSYAPHKLSMERTEEPAFTPSDRIGALELQNLSILDNRALLLHLVAGGAQLPPSDFGPLAHLAPKGT